MVSRVSSTEVTESPTRHLICVLCSDRVYTCISLLLIGTLNSHKKKKHQNNKIHSIIKQYFMLIKQCNGKYGKINLPVGFPQIDLLWIISTTYDWLMHLFAKIKWTWPQNNKNTYILFKICLWYLRIYSYLWLS